jgi:CubicO group peptidase (beta-lactamase class C family)
MNGFNELEQYFQELEKQEKFSGVILLTQGNKELFAKAYGYASRSWKVRNTLDTRFDTASITKLFTAVATLQLVDQKLLAFDTRVIEFLELTDTNISEEVTVYQLLTHSSGIGDDADEEAGESYEELWKTKPNYSINETADLLPQFIHKPPNFAPGQGCRYCNVGYILLGLLIEKVSGMSFRDYVRQNVFARVGMDHSGFLRMDRVNENVAEGNDPIRDDRGQVVGWKKNIYSFPSVGSPDGGSHVTAHDLDRFLRAAKAGELLSPTLTAAFFTPQVHHGPMREGTQEYGFGLWLFVDQFKQVIFCEKEGTNAGVSGLIRHYFNTDINVILLSNMEAGVWEPVRKVHDLIVAKHWA